MRIKPSPQVEEVKEGKSKQKFFETIFSQPYGREAASMPHRSRLVTNRHKNEKSMIEYALEFFVQ